MFAERLSADDTSRVKVYEDNPSKLGSRLDRVNRGSTNTSILQLNVVEFFLNTKDAIFRSTYIEYLPAIVKGPK